METVNLGNAKMEEQSLHVLLYGPPGAGKTHLLRDLPKPLLLMCFDGKYGPLVGVEGVEMISYSMGKPEDAGQIIPKFWKDWIAAKKDPKWATIAVDNITSIDSVLERYTVIKSGKGKTASERATIQEYGDMKRWYSTFFNSTASCKDKHVFVLAHEQWKEDEDSKVTAVTPYITGKIGAALGGMFKDTFHLEAKPLPTGQVKRILHYNQYKKYICSSTSLEGSGTIEEPTWDKIKACFKK